ncbi:MAG: hypothetical protein PUF99_00590 [Bacilli bacterium]|nr:hypothetical protein [Bacilli bacterium]
MSFTENFIKMIENISEEDGYKYQVIRSEAYKGMYAIEDDEKLIQAHIDHISEDYLIENRLETVVSHGYISNSGGVIAEILFRRKITNLEKMGAVIRYADEDLIREKFGNIEIDPNKIYRLATYKKIPESYIYHTDEKIIGAHMSDVLWELSQSDEFRLACIKGYVDGQAVAELLIYDIDGRDIK